MCTPKVSGSTRHRPAEASWPPLATRATGHNPIPRSRPLGHAERPDRVRGLAGPDGHDPLARAPITTASGISRSPPRVPTECTSTSTASRSPRTPTPRLRRTLGYWQLGGTVNDGWPGGTTTPYQRQSERCGACSRSELTPAQVQNEYCGFAAESGLCSHAATSHDPHMSSGRARAHDTALGVLVALADATLGSRTTAADVSRAMGIPAPTARPGITYGVSSPVEGANGRGITLDGVVRAGDRRACSRRRPTVYSVALWFKTTTTQGGAPRHLRRCRRTRRTTTRTGRSGSRRAGSSSSGSGPARRSRFESPGSYNDGNWHFVVATQGADGMHLYLDGQQVGSNTTSAGVKRTTGFWQVGIGVNPDGPTAPPRHTPAA